MTDELRMRRLLDKYMIARGMIRLLENGDDHEFFRKFMAMARNDTGADRVALLQRSGRNWRVVYAYGNHAPELGAVISLDGRVDLGPLDSWFSRPTPGVGWDAIFEVEGGLPRRTVLAVDDTDAERDFSDFKDLFRSIAGTLGGLIKVRRLMTRDILTGLPNQRACQERLDEELLRVIRRQPHRAAVALVAVDRYAMYEPVAADKVARYLGAMLRRGLPETAFVGRFEEDRFLVIMDDPMSDAASMLERMRNELAATRELIATCSVGLALLTPELALDPVLGRAQKALEAALAESDALSVDPASLAPLPSG